MNYPTGTKVIQNYMMDTGRIIQLPCLLDQPEPPDGFRAMICGTFSSGGNPNQIGPVPTSGDSIGITFDFTAAVTSNKISRIRSVGIALWQNSFGLSGIRLILNSGWALPIGGTQAGYYDGTSGNLTTADSITITDFLSAEPICGLWFPNSVIGDPPVTITGILVAANFKLNSSVFSSGGEF